MIKDIIVNVSRETREVDVSKNFVGNDGENLQGNIVFKFKDDFVDGVARLEHNVKVEGQDPYIMLEKVEDSYVTPIRSVITKVGEITMQLVITEESEDEDNIPIFKSNTFYVYCDESLNAEIEQPEEFPTWIEIANAKIDEMDKALDEFSKYKSYENLEDKPSIGGVELSGDQTLDDLGIQAKGDFVDDKDYVHTDNNYTDEDKNKLYSLKNYDDTLIKQEITSIGLIVDEHDKDISNIENHLDSIDEHNTEQDNKIKDLEKNKADTSKVTTIEKNVEKLTKEKQDKLIAGDNIKIEGNVISAEVSGEPGTTNYNELENKPKINNIILEGNKSLAEIGLVPYDDTLIKQEIDLLSDEVEQRSFITETGNKIDLEIDSKNYILTAKLYDKNNNLISTSSKIDLPLESVVVNVEYDKNTKEITITLQNGVQTKFSVSDLTSGLLTEDDLNKALVPYAKSTDIPTRTSKLINDSNFITNSDIPTKVSQLANDKNYIDSTALPIRVSELANDAGYITSKAVPTKVSQLDNDKNFITTADVPTKTSDLYNDAGFISDYKELDPTVPKYVKEIKQSDIDNWNNKSEFSGYYYDLDDIPEIPSKVSQLKNDKGFVTNVVNDLQNYYLKNETYTKDEVNRLIGRESGSMFEVVDKLPDEGKDNTIYLILSSTAGKDNIYDEYIWVKNKYELIGSTSMDLRNYVTNEQLTTELNKYVSNVSLQNTLKSYATSTDLTNATKCDNTSISKNESNELQSIGNIMQNGGYQKYWYGTKAEYNAIENKDPNTLYEVNDDEQTTLFEVDGSTIEFSNDNLLRIPNNIDLMFQSVLYGDGESGYRKYRNGLIEQWGVATTQANETEFSMHHTHKDTNFSIFIEPREQGNFYHYAIPSGEQKFKCRIQSRDSVSMAVKFQWRSYGRWK